METQRAFDGVLPVSVQRPENQETTCPKVNRLETEEELMLLFKSKVRKKDVLVPRQSCRKNSLLLGEGSAFLFYSGPLALGDSSLCYSTNLHLNLFLKHPHRDNQNHV